MEASAYVTGALPILEDSAPLLARSFGLSGAYASSSMVAISPSATYSSLDGIVVGC